MIRVKLLELYEKHDVTQKHVSQVTEIRESTLSGIARNTKAHLNVEILDRLCEYFDVKDISEILEYIPNEKTGGS
ncbi:helix-turn-helix domain-containing protein [Jeotgalicoccus halotolerans]|uniref:DNA-binding Xre family transcriptional regulator n=1 Tax=Jeotgalicoccus halotolerans TaxID=157227 RepID=A0A3E0AVP0_9STAP|nr:helix-turn-helix transcriptional regulator [Jeotgalicoccus halotolerans]REG23799.1 DNA-binding Xre family transcriptional regulator [Jeotgalicoccus halotolerans]